MRDVRVLDEPNVIMHVKRKNARRGKIVLCVGNEEDKLDLVGGRELVGTVEMFLKVSAVVRADRARAVRQALVGVVKLIMRFDIAPFAAFQYLFRDFRPRHRCKLRGERAELERGLEVYALRELMHIRAVQVHPAFIGLGVFVVTLRAD